MNVAIPEERAILRLLTISRTTTLGQAEVLITTFRSLPQNARAILIKELNIDAVHDGWGTLQYYAPALFNNALNSLSKTSHGLEPGIRTVLLAMARVFQESRIYLKGRTGNGVLTVNLESLASFALTEEYKANPNSLLNQQYDLFRHAGNENQLGIKLTPYPQIEETRFPQVTNIANLPGRTFAIIGIGGGSDGIQAAQLGLVLKANGKLVKLIGSVRTETMTTPGSTGTRAVTDHGGEDLPGIFRVLPHTQGSGRFLENIPANDFESFLILDREDASLASRIEMLLLQHQVDTLIAVDTGGDSLYSIHASADQSKATPDQDLRVLMALKHVKIQNRISAVVAVGVDSPANAQDILLQAKASYFRPNQRDSMSILNTYQKWKMDGSDENRFGKTSLAWQSALSQNYGVRVLPLPARVVADFRNPWNPFVNISPSMAGIFFMKVEDHLGAIAGIQ